MNLAGDIINYKSELYVSQDYILANANIGYGYLRIAKNRAKRGSKSWQYMELDNKSYFLYNTLPATAQHQLKPVAELLHLAREIQEDYLKLVDIAVHSSYKRFASLKNKDLSVAMAVLQEASIYVEQHNLSWSKSDFFRQLADEVTLRELKYLPKTWRHLRDKIREFAENGTSTITPKNIGNRHSAKHVDNPLLESWLVGMIESQKNFSAAYIYRNIRRMSLQHGLNKYPSQRWISDYINRPEVQYITQQRYGAHSRFNHKYRSYVPTQSALFAGDCWEMDGTRVNIIDHRANYTDRAGRKQSGQKFLFIVAVRDVMSGMILGWDYCYKENVDTAVNALAMAVKTAGYLPYEMRYDRFPGHNTDQWQQTEMYMRMIGTIMTVTHKAEGKASIERSWSTLQNVFMTDSDLYYGEGIKSTRRYAHRSAEYVAQVRKWAAEQGFDYDHAVRETDAILARAMNTPYSEYSRKFHNIDQSPAQLHEQSDKPNTYPIADYQWCFLFGINKQVSVANMMIRTDIDRVTHYYGIDDVEVIEQYTGVKLTTCFDHDDLSTVHLFDGDNYIGSFAEITPAQQYGAGKDMRAAGKIKAIAHKVKTHRTSRRDAIAEAELLSEAPAFSEVAMMQGGRIRKDQFEENESTYLLESWQAEEEELSITVKNQY